MLVNHVVLSPWNSNVCSKPSSKQQSSAIKNLRITASILYLIARSLDPLLPPIGVEEVEVITEIPPDDTLNELEVGGDAGIDIKDDTEKPDSANSDVKRDHLKEMWEWMKLKILPDLNAKKVVNEMHAEKTLLGDKRMTFDSMQDFHNLLLPLEYFVSTESNRELLDRLCKELRGKLNKWLSQFIARGLKFREEILNENTRDQEVEYDEQIPRSARSRGSARTRTSAKDGDRTNSASPTRMSARGDGNRDKVPENSSERSSARLASARKALDSVRTARKV